MHTKISTCMLETALYVAPSYSETTRVFGYTSSVLASDPSARHLRRAVLAMTGRALIKITLK